MKITGKFPSTRLRRVRNSEWIRRLVSENDLSTSDLIMPIFIKEGRNQKDKIDSMPGIFRYSIDNLNKLLDEAEKLKIPMISLFPYTPNDKKNNLGTEALNEKSLICKALKLIKRKKRNIGIMCDVALDPYTSHGHDGIVINDYIDNDKTLKVLCEQSLLYSQMGADILAPSDMMDGRIGAIRSILDKNNFKNINLLSYAVKYASSFYGPFRDAVGTKNNLKGDKKTYQMDFKNTNEALREVALDIKEGADIVMVKPGMPYLDIIRKVKDSFKIPVFSYQVSGEYSLIKNGIKKGIVDQNSIFESLMSLKRSGSSAIVTYFALEVAKKINN